MLERTVDATRDAQIRGNGTPQSLVSSRVGINHRHKLQTAQLAADYNTLSLDAYRGLTATKAALEKSSLGKALIELS